MHGEAKENDLINNQDISHEVKSVLVLLGTPPVKSHLYSLHRKESRAHMPHSLDLPLTFGFPLKTQKRVFLMFMSPKF